MQISKVLKLEVEGALEVLGPDGKPNFNSRRSVAVQVTDPKGRVLIDKKRIWQETDFVVGGTALGTYKLWCASPMAHLASALPPLRARAEVRPPRAA